MKKLILSCLVITLPVLSWAQLDAGNDTTICQGNSATLYATANTTGVTFTGLSTLSLTDDSYSGVINIGFPFTFYGNSYTQCLISSNNYITFDLTNANGFSPWAINNAAPSPLLPMNSIYCPYQDINPGAGGIIEYGTVGTAPNRIFVVRYWQVPMFSCTNLQFCSAVFLYEGSNNIETHLENKPLCATWNGGVAIHGTHNSTGTIADIVTGRNFPTQWTASLEGTLFTPNGGNAYTISSVPFQAVVSNNNIDWYDGGTLLGTGDSIVVSPTSTTTYTAQLTFCDGTIWTDDVVVNVAPPLSFSITETPTACAFNSGTANISTSGGSGFYTFSWNPGGYTDSFATNLGVGTYNVTVTDTVTGCIDNTTVNIVENNTVAISIDSVAPTSCNGGSDGAAYVSGVAGVPGYTWLWNDPMAQTDSTATGLPPGTWQVVITDTDGCQDSTTVTITEPTAISLAVGGTVDVSCNGGSDGLATISTSGGTPGYTYLWDDPGAQTTNPASNLPAGTWTVIVTDTMGCMDTIQVTITEPTALGASIVQTTDVSCNGGGDGSGEVAGSGGTAPYSYEWLGLGVFSADAYNLPAGTYDVEVTDAQGCTFTIQVTINEPAPNGLTITDTQASCGSNDGTLTATPQGGSAPFSYQWDAAAGSQTTGTATGLGVGTYNVTVTDANGCITTGSGTVTDTLDISASFNATPAEGIPPLNVAFGNTSTGNWVSFDWDYGDGTTESTTSTNTTHTYTAPGVYIVTMTVYNAGGCTAVATFTIIVNNESSLHIPNVFSPNNDGMNDIWRVTHEAIVEYECTITNRWGKEVYNYADVNAGWDGGEESEGTYYYMIIATGDDNVQYNETGTITLVR